jgi:hypothetical protein
MTAAYNQYLSQRLLLLLLLLLRLQARGVFDAAKREELVRLAKSMAPAGTPQTAAAAAVTASSRLGQEVCCPLNTAAAAILAMYLLQMHNSSPQLLLTS